VLLETDTLRSYKDLRFSKMIQMNVFVRSVIEK